MMHPTPPYACRPEASRGRLVAELEGTERDCFARDRDRIIHTTAFRRLKHKTQVFVGPEGDHVRTRLTHTVEVAQVARSLARALGVNEDLAEAVALAHDLGHPPFAHAGQEALAACMAPHGGFEHNDQALRIVTLLERRYPRWDGLNLTLETLEGIAKHGGPVAGPFGPGLAAVAEKADLYLGLHAPLEAQLAGIADDIAYTAHDIEDGLRAGLISPEDLEDLALPGAELARMEAEYGALEPRIAAATLVREVLGAMAQDVLTATRGALAALKPSSAKAIRTAGLPLVAFSTAMAVKVAELRAFLMARVYRHPSVLAPAEAGQRVVEGLFAALMDGRLALPEDWEPLLARFPRARVVADYIAGMSDTYAARLSGQGAMSAHAK
ncbi:MAG TPA: deoxyguanosinetriphosphate triphosphohydrolase [Rhodospirillaceae bacterium]|jgi:dGTPase|nr:deoxyguanosinetriphosphate triphosphohydrolase [Alphaproteobacteria bacterium]HBH25886.1 deoxyguanosinetriphosphate triphosphohydrolase [Rhodospirillaceae bacterium]